MIAYHNEQTFIFQSGPGGTGISKLIVDGKRSDFTTPSETSTAFKIYYLDIVGITTVKLPLLRMHMLYDVWCDTIL